MMIDGHGFPRDIIPGTLLGCAPRSGSELCAKLRVAQHGFQRSVSFFGTYTDEPARDAVLD